MSNLPSGTVTFLFTDIEGSTKRWEEHAHQMSAALSRHDDLLRTTIEANGGYVFKTVGDAFCAAFSAPPDALAAARQGAEAPRVGKLQRDSGGERDRQDEEPRDARDHGRSAGEREREGHEAGSTPCLREGNRVREAREDPRHELDDEHDQRSADDERGPAATRGKSAERDDDERGDRDGSATREHFRSQCVTMDRVHCQLIGIARNCSPRRRSRR